MKNTSKATTSLEINTDGKLVKKHKVDLTFNPKTETIKLVVNPVTRIPQMVTLPKGHKMAWIVKKGVRKNEVPVLIIAANREELIKKANQLFGN